MEKYLYIDHINDEQWQSTKRPTAKDESRVRVSELDVYWFSMIKGKAIVRVLVVDSTSFWDDLDNK